MRLALEGHINSIADFDAEQKADAVRVWRRLSLFIISHMKAGFSEEEIVVREKGAESQSSK